MPVTNRLIEIVADGIQLQQQPGIGGPARSLVERRGPIPGDQFSHILGRAHPRRVGILIEFLTLGDGEIQPQFFGAELIRR